jgi:uncharacterized protein
MRGDSLIKWFMPKEERFHDLFGRDTQTLLKSARLFADIARSGSVDERRIKTIELKAIEREGDDLTRQIFEALNSTFITPLDREDIRSIASDLDDILDHLESVAQYLVIFELAESPEGLRQFADILVKMTEEIDKVMGLVWDLSNERHIAASIVRISDLENQGDALYSTLIAELFRHGGSPVEILKWKEVFEGLEEACDSCKDFAHVLGNVVIKSA